MMRAEAEARDQTFTYTAGTADGQRPAFWHAADGNSTGLHRSSRQVERYESANRHPMENGDMSDTPKFEVIDRRKIKAEEEQENAAKRAARPQRRSPRRLSRQPVRGWW